MVSKQPKPATALNANATNGTAAKMLKGVHTNGTIAAAINGHAANGVPTNGPANGHQFQIRLAKAEDAKALRSLIQELADHQEMPDGPRISAEQIADDFASGAMQSLVALGSQGEMAAYAVYYLPGCSTQGQVMHLEDLYIRPAFRRRGLGFKLLREIAKIAHAQRLPYIEWQVLRSNQGAIVFYKTLPGLEDHTDEKETNKSIFWRLSAHAFGHILRKAVKQQQNASNEFSVEVHLDECRAVEGSALRLAEQWHILTAFSGEQRRKEKEEIIFGKDEEFENGVNEGGVAALRRNSSSSSSSNSSTNCGHPVLPVLELAKLLRKGLLGAIVVRKEEGEKEVLGMAFFHRKSYSTWQGRFPVLDNIFVAEFARRRGIGTAILSELVKIAQKMGATKIQWEAPEGSEECSQHVPFFNSLNADNLTDAEGWLLYRWFYEQQFLVEQEQQKQQQNGNGVVVAKSIGNGHHHQQKGVGEKKNKNFENGEHRNDEKAALKRGVVAANGNGVSNGCC